MPKDMRDIIKDAEQHPLDLRKGHRSRFEKRLSTMHNAKRSSIIFFMKVAASLLVLVGLSYFVINSIKGTDPGSDNQLAPSKFTSLGSISPEMQKVESYYLTAINYELASLEDTPETKKLVDQYLEKIGKLETDRERLNTELAEKGLNEKTINSLITNLQLQLQLLLQLKDEINEIKLNNANNHEENTI